MENEKKTRRHSIFNLFDIIVIVLVLVLAVILLFVKNGGTEQATAQTSTVRYTIELTGMTNNSAKLAGEGDELVDKVKKYNIGTVESVDISATTQQVTDMENGEVLTSVVPGQQTATMVVTAQAAETSTQITVDGGFVIRVGMPVSVKGPGYWGNGYIIAVERSDDK